MSQSSFSNLKVIHMLSDRDYMRNPPPRGYRRATAPQMSLVKRLIIVNCVVYLLCILTGGERSAIGSVLALSPAKVMQGEFWRLASYMFVHGGTWHLFFNMYGVYLFGSLLEHPLGEKRFLALYLTSGLIGGLLWMLANWGSHVPCVGASGALFGLMVAAAMAFPQASFMLLIPPIPVKLWVLVWVYVFIELFSLQGNSNIAHLAHLGGALGGFLFMRRLGGKLTFPKLDFLRKFFHKPAKGPWTTPQKPAGGGGNKQPLDSEELDRVLDRISIVGYDKLSDAEKETLRKASERLRER